MRKGEMLPTTTEVLDHFEANMNDKYYGSVSMFNTYIEEIYNLYVVEYDTRATGMGIEHKTFEYRDDAEFFYNETVLKIKKEIVEDLTTDIGE